MAVWGAKVVVVLGLMPFYDFTYGVDPDGYFVNASSPGFTWQGFQLGQGTVNTQMLTWLHIKMLSSSFEASRLSFALLGLVAVFLVYRAGTICIGREEPRLFFALALMPSILFWSSILGKDPIAMFGIAAYVYGVVAWHKLEHNLYLIWAAMGVTVAVYVRIWFGPILLIPLAILGLMKAESLTKRAVFVSLGLIGLAASPIVMQQAIGVDMTQQEDLLESTQRLSRIFPSGGSSLDVPDLATPGEIARFAPLGMFTALFRPLPGEVQNVFGFLAGIDGAVLLLLAVRALWRVRPKDLKEPLVPWAFSVILLWAGIYAVASFQNLGTMSRYRLQIMPLFLGTLFYLGRKRVSVQTARRLVLMRGTGAAAARQPLL